LWLIDRTMQLQQPRGGPSYPDPEEVIVRVIGAKYPERLGPLYQTVLLKMPEGESELLAKAVAISKLPREQKIALLEQGISHKDFAHRYAALDALADVDVAVFRKHLVRALEQLPNEIKDSDFEWSVEADVGRLVYKAGDRKCWDTLAATTRRVSVEFRF